MALRQALAAVTALLVLGSPAWGDAPAPAATPPRLVLLGTAGGPAIRLHRAQIASLIEVGGKRYLVDCGEGCVTQLKRAGIEAAQVNAVFVTHLHLDHIAGLTTLGAFAWSSGKGAHIAVHGPPGTAALVTQGLAQFSAPERIFAAEVPGMGRVATGMTATDHLVPRTGITEVFRDDHVRVLAAENTHLAHLAGQPFAFGEARSYSYRFEMAGKAIVFTGDTGASPAVEALARGADVLVSEVMDVDATMAMFRTRRQLSDAEAEAIERQMRAKHLSPEDVGRLAQAAGVKKIILSHDASAGDEAGRERSDALAAKVRTVYSGEVVAGQDLDVF